MHKASIEFSMELEESAKSDPLVCWRLQLTSKRHNGPRQEGRRISDSPRW